VSLTAWSWMLTVVSIFGLWLSGRNPRAGWVFAACNQQVWLAYAMTTDQWGFAIQSVAFTIMYVRNLMRWRNGPPPAVMRQVAKAYAARCASGMCGAGPTRRVDGPETPELVAG